MKYHVRIDEWNGDKHLCTHPPMSLEQAEAIVKGHFGDVEWSDTQVGFQVHHELTDEQIFLLFAEGGPELWEISMVNERGELEDWDESLLDGQDHPEETWEQIEAAHPATTWTPEQGD
jgi:hypothetical protein